MWNVQVFLLTRWHKWFDQLEEPKRFLTFFIPMAIALAAISAGSMIVCAIAWAFVAILAITRIFYLMNGSKS